MNTRETILCGVAFLVCFVAILVTFFGVLDSQIDRMAAARMASAFRMTIGKTNYQCYADRKKNENRQANKR